MNSALQENFTVVWQTRPCGLVDTLDNELTEFYTYPMIQILSWLVRLAAFRLGQTCSSTRWSCLCRWEQVFYKQYQQLRCEHNVRLVVPRKWWIYHILVASPKFTNIILFGWQLQPLPSKILVDRRKEREEKEERTALDQRTRYNQVSVPGQSCGCPGFGSLASETQWDRKQQSSCQQDICQLSPTQVAAAQLLPLQELWKGRRRSYFHPCPQPKKWHNHRTVQPV